MGWLAIGVLAILAADSSGEGVPGSRPPSDQTYRARWSPQWEITVDGSLDDPHWSRATPEARFVFPWRQVAAPATEFRALLDEKFLYFAFRVEDSDIFVLDKLRDEEDAVFKDRVEIYFVRDDRMREYYCLEVDSRGRAFDYRGAFYRRLDPAWGLQGLETAGRAVARGYEVEARVPIASLESLGFPRLEPGAKIRWGLHRPSSATIAAAGRSSSARPSTIEGAASRAPRQSKSG